MCARCIANNMSPFEEHPSARTNARATSDEKINVTIRMVKSYLMNNLGCQHKEVRLALGLTPTTLRRAITAIRAEQKAHQMTELDRRRMHLPASTVATNFAEYLRKKDVVR